MGEPLSLDPGVIEDYESAQVAGNIFETLVARDQATNRIIPCLARAWETSPDGKVWTFYLRKGVTFHDGTPFDSRAVKFSWERQMLREHPYHNPPYGRFIFYHSVWGGFPGNIKSISATDDLTVTVTLYSKSHRFLEIVSRLPFAIVSPSAVMSRGADFSTRPVGTGPFRFVEWRSWQRIVLTGNAEYWGRRPYLDRLIFEPTPGDLSRRRQIARGRIDIMENPTRIILEKIKSGELGDLRIKTLPSSNFSFISLNCTAPPLDRPLVRRALNFAVDRQRILREIYEWMPPATSPFETLWGREIAGRGYPVNHDTARALLAKAGLPRGFTLELWYPMLPRPYASSPEKVAKGVARCLEDVGVKVDLKGVKWETYLQKLRSGQHQAALTGAMGMEADPELYFQVAWNRNNAVLGGTNLSFYRNDRIHSLLNAARFSADEETCLDAFRQIQQILAEEAVMIPLFHNQSVVVMDKAVMGVSAGLDGIIDFSGVWLRK
jgi:peptide/nickel transport system substrate-binding protein